MRHKQESSVVTLTLLVALFLSPMVTLLKSESTLAESTATESSSPSFKLPEEIPVGTNLRVDGSSSMTVINQALKQGFEQKYSNAKVEINARGTDTALKALENGKIDLAAIGRPLTPEEKAKGFVSVPVGREKIAMIVGPDNPFNGSITYTQFAQIFRGEITDWSELGGPKAKIRVIDRPETSDTRQAFLNYPVFQKQEFTTGSNATQVGKDETQEVIKKLGQDGIGYAIANQVFQKEGVRVILMHQVLPNDAKYPFSQPLVYVYKENSNPTTECFVGLATEETAQKVIQDNSIFEGATTNPDQAETSKTANSETTTATPTATKAEQPNTPNSPTTATTGSKTKLEQPNTPNSPTTANTETTTEPDQANTPNSETTATTGSKTKAEQPNTPNSQTTANTETTTEPDQANTPNSETTAATATTTEPDQANTPNLETTATTNTTKPEQPNTPDSKNLETITTNTTKPEQPNTPDSKNLETITANTTKPEQPNTPNSETTAQTTTANTTKPEQPNTPNLETTAQTTTANTNKPEQPNIPNLETTANTGSTTKLEQPNTPNSETTAQTTTANTTKPEQPNTPNLETTANTGSQTKAEQSNTPNLGTTLQTTTTNTTKLEKPKKPNNSNSENPENPETKTTTIDKPNVGNSSNTNNNSNITTATTTNPNSNEEVAQDKDLGFVPPIGENLKSTSEVLGGEIPIWLWLLPLPLLLIFIGLLFRNNGSTPPTNQSKTTTDFPVVGGASPDTKPVKEIQSGVISNKPSTVTNTSVASTTGAKTTIQPTATTNPTSNGMIAATPNKSPDINLGTAAVVSGLGILGGSVISSKNNTPTATLGKELQVNPNKFYLGQINGSNSSLKTVDVGLAELPNGYNEKCIVLIPRDPEWAYAYWDIPNEEKEKLILQGGSQLALRLYDVTNINLNQQPPHSVEEFECDHIARDWYLPIPMSDRDYIVEIGYLTASGVWLLLARSAPVRVPPLYPSDWSDDKFIKVPWDEQLQSGKTFIKLVPPDTKELAYNNAFLFAFNYEQEQKSDLSKHSSGVEYSRVDSSKLIATTGADYFLFFVDTSLIVYGATQVNAQLSINGEPVKLENDGSFGINVPFPEGVTESRMMGVAVNGLKSESLHLKFTREIPQPTETKHLVDGNGLSFAPTEAESTSEETVNLSNTSSDALDGDSWKSIVATNPDLFWLFADASLIIYGAAQANTKITINGKAVKLEDDGSFGVNKPFPEGTWEYHIVAVAPDESKTEYVHLRFTRQTLQHRKSG
ncbi:MAG: DUF4912 domain-containing protein [Microcoleaceae cyanobacterium MO_207.B10]|nr:DUF4912 domain-containing protein [Microcoleaceae cyanobacterium MO_207.B10]